MKKLLTILPFLLFSIAVFAQPANDDCAGIVYLGIAPSCTPTVYNNINATASMIGNDNLPVSPSCLGIGQPTHDVWFQFTAADTIFDYRIKVTGTGSPILTTPLVILYRGDCMVDGLAEAACIKANPGDTEVQLDVVGLTPGLEYFIRVTDYSASTTWGNFTICVDEIPPATDITKGGSSLGKGILFDSGGADGNYQPDENYTFVICPTDAPACLTFTLDYYNLENGQTTGVGEYLTFYDGPTADPNNVIANIGGSFEPFPTSGPDVTGGGGACFPVVATSGCMTIVFTSDSNVEFEGFKGHWESSATPCEVKQPILVDDNITNAQIEAIVAAAATQVTITNIQCAAGGYGTFLAGDKTELGLEKGLILTSGSALNAVGPNIAGGSAGFNPPGDGDSDLDYLSTISGGGQLSHDACVVELDVFVATPELTFEYIFGSEEYTTFVNSNYNDIFAFLVSGPGIVGDPNIGNQKNISVLPNTNTPVQINSVNHLTNWQYYRNNENGLSVGYDGLTIDSLGIKKSLTARQKVTPCNTYHLKLAVADRGDWTLDSGVFISEIKGGAPKLSVQFASGIDYLIEKCTGSSDQLIIKLENAPDTATTYIVQISGSAINGIDYTLPIPPVITFLPGISQLSFPIIPIADNIAEGQENIVVKLVKDYGCGAVVLETIDVKLEDAVVVKVTAGDTALVCAGGTLQLEATGAANYFWTPPGVVSNPNIANPTIKPLVDTWLHVVGTVGTCVSEDSVYVHIISPMIDAMALAPTNICLGASVPLQETDNVNHEGLVWTPSAGLSDDKISNPIATPTESTTYTATVTIAGCSVSKSVSIKVDTLFVPKITTTDTTICQNYSVKLADDVLSTTIYKWSPPLGLSATDVSGPLATPTTTKAYQLISTSANGYCADTMLVQIFVIPADVSITGDPYREICLGDSLQLYANVSGGGSLVWTASTGPLTNPTFNPFWAKPDETTVYTATFSINNCVVFDSIRIRVDSLPDQTLTLMPYKDVYCPGEKVLIKSPTYEPANFPDLFNDKNHMLWVPNTGATTPDTLWNLVIETQDTITFQRIIHNRACVDTASITVNVFTPLLIMASVDDNYTCPGDTVHLNATGHGTYGVEWSGGAVSDVNAQNPTANPTTTTTYKVKVVGAPCPAAASVTVDVAPTPLIQMNVNPVLCTDEWVQLQYNADPNVSFVWTGPNNYSSMQNTPILLPPLATGVYSTTATGVNNCKATAQTTVSVASATIEAGPDQTICPEVKTNVVLVAQAIGNPDLPTGKYHWSSGGETAQTDIAPPQTTTTYFASYTYPDGGHCVAFDSMKVIVAPGVNFLGSIVVTPDPTDTVNNIYCEGTHVLLKSNAFSTAMYSFQWELNGKEITGATKDTVSVFLERTSPNPNKFKVVATTKDGCTATLEGSVPTKKCLDAPNAFTPNADGLNDFFEPLFVKESVKIVDMKVYSRWGEVVYDNADGLGKWNGKINDKEAPMDVYVFKITFRLPDGSLDSRTGDVTLIR